LEGVGFGSVEGFLWLISLVLSHSQLLSSDTFNLQVRTFA
jgi:hypothetical protein